MKIEKDLRIASLYKDRELMIKYLSMKIQEEDWHGVADAAMDLRDIDAELKGLEFDK